MKVLLAGDSTVAACLADETPMSGWGAHLGAPLNARLTQLLIAEGRLAADDDPVIVPVLNVAKGGATTASFRGEHLWEALLEQAEPGDFVVLQFGHNDAKEEALAADAGYRDNLTRFVAEVRAAGCRPVLCTPVARRTPPPQWPWLDAAHGAYPGTVRELAARLEAPLIDLTVATLALHERLGSDGSRRLFTQFPPGGHPLYPDGIEDNTHYAFAGASLVADIVARRLAPLLSDAFARESGAAGRDL